MNIIYLSHGQVSPMVNHKPMEIAVDDESRTFYVPGIMAATYGTDSTEKSCKRYSSLNWKG